MKSDYFGSNILNPICSTRSPNPLAAPSQTDGALPQVQSLDGMILFPPPDLHLNPSIHPAIKLIRYNWNGQKSKFCIELFHAFKSVGLV
jgi:hypothetical protein